MKKLLAFGLLTVSLLTACNDNKTTPTGSTGTGTTPPTTNTGTTTPPVTAGGGTTTPTTPTNNGGTTNPPAEAVSTLTHLGGTVYQGNYDSSTNIITPQAWSHGTETVNLLLDKGGTIGQSPVLTSGTVNSSGQLSIDLPAAPPVEDIVAAFDTQQNTTADAPAMTCTNNMQLSNPAMKIASAYLEGASQTHMATVVGLQSTSPLTDADLHKSQYALLFADSAGTINGTLDCTLPPSVQGVPAATLHTKFNGITLLKGWNVILSTLTEGTTAGNVNVQVSNAPAPTIWYSGSN